MAPLQYPPKQHHQRQHQRQRPLPPPAAAATLSGDSSSSSTSSLSHSSLEDDLLLSAGIPRSSGVVTAGTDWDKGAGLRQGREVGEVDDPPPRLDDVVAVNAGGTRIETLRRIWMQVEGSMLEAKFRQMAMADVRDGTGVLFLPHRGYLVEAMVAGLEAIAIEPALGDDPLAPAHWYAPPVVQAVGTTAATATTAASPVVTSSWYPSPPSQSSSSSSSFVGFQGEQQFSWLGYPLEGRTTTTSTTTTPRFPAATPVSATSNNSWSHSDVVQFRYMLDYYGVTLGLYRIGVYHVPAALSSLSTQDGANGGGANMEITAMDLFMRGLLFDYPPQMLHHLSSTSQQQPPSSQAQSSLPTSFRKYLRGWCADTVNPVTIEIATPSGDETDTVYLLPLTEAASPFDDDEQHWYVKSFEVRRVAAPTFVGVGGELDDDDDATAAEDDRKNAMDKALLGWQIGSSEPRQDSSARPQRLQPQDYYHPSHRHSHQHHQHHHHADTNTSTHRQNKMVELTLPVGSVVRMDDLGRHIYVDGELWVPPPAQADMEQPSRPLEGHDMDPIMMMMMQDDGVAEWGRRHPATAAAIATPESPSNLKPNPRLKLPPGKYEIRVLEVTF